MIWLVTETGLTPGMEDYPGPWGSNKLLRSDELPRVIQRNRIPSSNLQARLGRV